MVTITSDKGKMIMSNTDGRAKVGRWCNKKHVPDRCYSCFEVQGDSIVHRSATAFVEVGNWRHGICDRCQDTHDIVGIVYWHPGGDNLYRVIDYDWLLPDTHVTVKCLNNGLQWACAIWRIRKRIAGLRAS